MQFCLVGQLISFVLTYLMHKCRRHDNSAHVSIVLIMHVNMPGCVLVVDHGSAPHLLFTPHTSSQHSIAHAAGAPISASAGLHFCDPISRADQASSHQR
jgi:hypothetical protein